MQSRIISAFAALLCAACNSSEGDTPKGIAATESRTEISPDSTEPEYKKFSDPLTERRNPIDLESFIRGRTFTPINHAGSNLLMETFGKDGKWAGDLAGIDITTRTGTWSVERDVGPRRKICVKIQKSNSMPIQEYTICRIAEVISRNSIKLQGFNNPSKYYTSTLSRSRQAEFPFGWE